jgi:class 3 adenylate cyclase
MNSMHKNNWQRKGAIALLILSFIFTVGLLFKSMEPKNYFDADGMDLSGEWLFHNGAQGKDHSWEHVVSVPKPLPEEIRNSLKSEYWYRKDLILSDSIMRAAEPISISLGSIKGAHEVYWNRQFLGARDEYGLALYRVPRNFLSNKNVRIELRVQKIKSAFPGIVHFNPMPLGRSRIIENQELDFYFQTGIKPLIPSFLKGVLFFLFLSLFALIPNRPEYLSFSFFSLFGAASSAMYSRFLPFYNDYYFRNALIFTMFALGLACIPVMTANFLRLGKVEKFWALFYGASVGIVMLLSAIFLRSQERLVSLYQLFQTWSPIIILSPCIFFAARQIFRMRRHKDLSHRVWQISFYTFCLITAMLSWGVTAKYFFRFDKLLSPELIDLGVFVGIGSAFLLDFRFASLRSERVGNAVPKWFQSMLVNARPNMTVEHQLLAMAVDTVGYTKALSKSDSEEKRKIHQSIRVALALLTEVYGAQKLSDRGDGALYAWDYPSDAREREALVQKVLFACRAISRGIEGGLQFRAGMAAGLVRCEWRQGDFSFLGEALNSASRLESIAKPGTILVDESLIEDFRAHLTVDGWLEAEVKGLRYRGKVLSKIS